MPRLLFSIRDFAARPDSAPPRRVHRCRPSTLPARDFPRLFMFAFFDCAARQIIQQDLPAGIAVIFDVSAQSFEIINTAPGVAIDLHQAEIAGRGSERCALFDVLAPAAFLPGRRENDLAVNRLVRIGQFRLVGELVAQTYEQASHRVR